MVWPSTVGSPNSAKSIVLLGPFTNCGLVGVLTEMKALDEETLVQSAHPLPAGPSHILYLPSL